jgi:hypothetical protein
VSGTGRAREWAIENLNVAQLLVTTQSASTGRTNQAFAENVSIEGQKLIGPWRVEGTTSGVPFRLVTGELAEDKSVQVKLSGGGDIYPRFDLDARLGLSEGSGDATTPQVTGKAKILFGPPAQESRSLSWSRPNSRRCRAPSSSTRSAWRRGRAARACA